MKLIESWLKRIASIRSEPLLVECDDGITRLNCNARMFL